MKLSVGNGTRYSLGLFTFNNGVTEVPQELIDDKYPLAYKPCDHRGFIRFHASGEARKHPNPLKAYCGVSVWVNFTTSKYSTNIYIYLLSLGNMSKSIATFVSLLQVFTGFTEVSFYWESGCLAFFLDVSLSSIL